MDDNQFLQADLPAAKGGLGVSSARLLALPASLASAVGAKNALREVFGLEPMMMHLNSGLNLEKLIWLRKTKCKKKIGKSQFLTANRRLDFTNRTNGYKTIQRVPREVLLPRVERHPVQKIKVKAVKPLTQNCNRNSIRLKKLQTA